MRLRCQYADRKLYYIVIMRAGCIELLLSEWNESYYLNN